MKCTLSDIAEVTMGQSPKSEFYNTEGVGIPFLQGNRTFGRKYPVFDTYTTRITKMAKAGDVIMSVRAPVGELNITPVDICLGRGVCGIRMKKGNQDFLFYLLKYYMPHLLNKESGTVFGSVNKNDINGLEIEVPDNEDDEVKISRYLTMFDNKIELNVRINKNLEQQAQALFKSWFLDYEPWDGSVPNSWNNGKLGDFAEIKRGGSPRPIQEYLSDSGLRWLKISDVTSLQTPFIIDIKDHIIEAGLRKTVFLKAGSLVLSNSATPGIPKILDVDSCIHDGWLYFPESKFSKEYLYLYFKYIRQQLVNLSNGSVFNNLKTDILKGYPTILPDKETLQRFDDIVMPMFLQIQNLTRESHKLADMRDVLLPKLMSGELDVSNIDL